MEDSGVLFCGEALATLRLLPADSAYCCVTSPPYYGLRDYGEDAQIGLEETPGEYVNKLVEVFCEVRRVLRSDGTLWLNIGDSYNARPGQRKTTDKAGEKQQSVRGSQAAPSRSVDGLKPKDLIGIPWMLAFALRADGWYLRQDIIWHKPNAMPESVKDRCTKAHEYVFLLSKSSKYYFDSEAIKEAAVGGNSGKAASFKRENSKREQTIPNQGYGTHRPERGEVAYNGDKRNRRSVWSVPTRAYKGAHFAVFPPQLIEPCVLSGCPEGGTVLDPFFGSGTTGEVAQKFGRRWLGIELNPAYCALARQRVAAE